MRHNFHDSPLRTPNHCELSFANSIMKSTLSRSPLVYCRLDIVLVSDGGYALLEFEACDSALYFGFRPEAAVKLANFFLGPNDVDELHS